MRVLIHIILLKKMTAINTFKFCLVDAFRSKYYRRSARHSVSVGRTIETSGTVRIILVSGHSLSTRIAVSCSDWRQKKMREWWLHQEVRCLFATAWRNHDKLIIYIILFYRLIKHTEKLLEETEEKLCVKVLRTLREMMAIDPEYGEKVNVAWLYFAWSYMNHLSYKEDNTASR